MTNFTIEAWVNPDNDPGVPGIFIQKLRNRDGQANYTLGIDTENQPFIAYQTASGAMLTLTLPVSLPKGKWSHVAATFDRDLEFNEDEEPFDELVIYGFIPDNNNVFSEFREASKSFGIPGRGTGNLTIGSGVDPNQIRQSFDGQMDEVRIWNHARSQVQIAQSRIRTLVGNEEQNDGVDNNRNNSVDEDGEFTLVAYYRF